MAFIRETHHLGSHFGSKVENGCRKDNIGARETTYASITVQGKRMRI